MSERRARSWSKREYEARRGARVVVRGGARGGSFATAGVVVRDGARGGSRRASEGVSCSDAGHAGVGKRARNMWVGGGRAVWSGGVIGYRCSLINYKEY